MNDDQSPNRVVAIDLCSRGFHIWRVYINSMELLRSLSRLAVGTSAQKEDADLRNLVQLARTGVLRIAKTNTPLFISTISLDIMDTNSIEHRGSTMQLIAYIIRRVRRSRHLLICGSYSYTGSNDIASEFASSCRGGGQVFRP